MREKNHQNPLRTRVEKALGLTCRGQWNKVRITMVMNLNMGNMSHIKVMRYDSPIPQFLFLQQYGSFFSVICIKSLKGLSPQHIQVSHVVKKSPEQAVRTRSAHDTSFFSS